MGTSLLLQTEDVRTFANSKTKKNTGQIIGGAIAHPVITYAKRSLITSIRDNFVIKHSSGVTKRSSNSSLSPRQITCKVFSYSNNVVVQRSY